MIHLEDIAQPRPSNGVMLAALKGPHDPMMAASIALQHLMDRDGTELLAQGKPDQLYIYSHLVPTPVYQNGVARVDWPYLQVRQSPGEGKTPGPVFLSGWRPNLGLEGLAWDVAEICRATGVRNILNLTAGMAELAHTRPTRFVLENRVREEQAQEILRQLAPEDGEMKGLEDPFLMQAAMNGGLGYTSLCALIPQYIDLHPNHRVAAEIAQRAGRLCRNSGEPLAELEELSAKFQERMLEIVENNPMLQQLGHVMEQHEDRRREKLALAQQRKELEEISPQEMALAAEEFIRQLGQK